ncbi:MAG: UvrB/UvrC motif-containing protein [Akkermansia sp.]
MKKCQICGKRATMFLTQIIEGKVTELALCAACAEKKGLFDPQNLTFAERLFPEKFRARVEELVRELAGEETPFSAGAKHKPQVPDMLTRCPICDFTLENYRSSGRLGCPECYRVFAGELNPETTANESEDDSVPPNVQRARLEQELQQAISREDFEKAAQLRDQLKGLES